MSKPKPQKGRNIYPPRERPTCGKSGNKHVGECLIGTNNCYGCGKDGRMVKDFPNVRSQGKGSIQYQSSGPRFEAPKRNQFYALKARGEQENSPDIVTSMLQVLSINFYALFDLGATLSFVTPMVARKFDVLLDVLIEPFSVCIQMGFTMVSKRVYRKCPMMLPNRVTLADLVELNMFDFDIILGMDWVHDCFASIDCRTRVVKFQFPKEPIIK